MKGSAEKQKASHSRFDSNVRDKMGQKIKGKVQASIVKKATGHYWQYKSSHGD
jgi:hypothetical protein